MASRPWHWEQDVVIKREMPSDGASRLFDKQDRPSDTTRLANDRQGRATDTASRLFDLSICLLVIAVLWPVGLLVACLIRVRLGSPVLFRQPRPGLDGVVFDLLKFRTMTNAVDEQGELLPDQQRLTRFGRFIRSTSLDELPELINVLRGDMSLVGPRPLFVKYLHLYSAEQARRHDVRPGITGWAQVNGRNQLPWAQRFDMDVWYVDNHSLLLDMKILVITAWKVLRREGINPEGRCDTPHFTGDHRQHPSTTTVRSSG